MACRTAGLFYCTELSKRFNKIDMRVSFYKYQALSNDFLVIDRRIDGLPNKRLSSISRQLCDRSTGVGADGVLYLEKSRGGLTSVDVYNSDGSWAEKSGNGLRIVGYHLHRQNKRNRLLNLEMGGALTTVKVNESSSREALLTTELGRPDFTAQAVPMTSKQPYMINAALSMGGRKFPVTCLSIGNPHTVLFVDHFDFDWQQLGADIETNKAFPNGTNVEFVKVLSQKRLQVADWERGAGATGSSGTGAAAAVAAAVTLGVAERKCKVVFETGILQIYWRDSDDVIELTGPVEFVFEGCFKLR